MSCFRFRSLVSQSPNREVKLPLGPGLLAVLTMMSLLFLTIISHTVTTVPSA
jgi:hypothetical protein